MDWWIDGLMDRSIEALMRQEKYDQLSTDLRKMLNVPLAERFGGGGVWCHFGICPFSLGNELGMAE